MKYKNLFGEEAEINVEESGGVGEGVATDTNGNEILDDTNQDSRDFKAEFKNLIKGEYKDAYQAELQRVIDKRFKNSKANEDLLNQYESVLAPLYSKYGVDDVNKLKSAIDNDESLWEEKAFEQGLTVEQYREIENLKHENQALINAQKQREQLERVNQIKLEWEKDAEEIRSLYDEDFDIETEISENEQFKKLVTVGISVKDAYRTCNMDKILKSNTEAVSALTQKKVTDNIKAKGNRPSENGLNATSPTNTRIDVSKLTPRERREYALRASRGERIDFIK